MRFQRSGPGWPKTLCFLTIHLVIAVTIGWWLTGSFVLAGTLAIVEPLANSVAHYFFDRWWDAGSTAAAAPAAAT